MNFKRKIFVKIVFTIFFSFSVPFVDQLVVLVAENAGKVK
ncbi:MAG: hypothetical protein JWQ54_2241 [Mucilaginibacter sp.]|nr:hypothetical protein [Mucilaginibacter sp.]